MARWMNGYIDGKTAKLEDNKTDGLVDGGYLFGWMARLMNGLLI